MRVVANASIFISLLLFLAIQSSNALPFNRTLFPSSFIFGAGSAAYQLEGGTGFWTFKGPSIWDTFTKKHPEKIEDHSNGDVAEDFYNRYKDDIKLIKQIGLDSFRFSISWSRLFPKGKGLPNCWGVRFYNNVINELLANGITPFVTLFHWDLPQALEDEYGGFRSRKIVKDFQDYAEFCFKTFGDRVKHWATMNEPYIFTTRGYNEGTLAPGRCSNYVGNCTHGDSSTEPYIVSHHMLLSHAAVYRLYKTQFQGTQKGEIGITLNTNWFVPKYNTYAHLVAAHRALDFSFGWHAHPITYGDYPQNMKLFVGDRLPKFTKFESELLKKSYDFIGINYYTSNYAESAHYTAINKSFTTDQQLNLTFRKGDVPIGTPTDLKWLYICPEGLHRLMLYIKDRYQNPQIYITENGVADTASKPLGESLNDTIRITYIEGHLKNLLQSIKDGVNVKGYFVWSFLDDFEWGSGYTVRFGITYVDYKNNLKRYLKDSAKWLKSFLFIPRVINQVIDQPLEQEINY